MFDGLLKRFSIGKRLAGVLCLILFLLLLGSLFGIVQLRAIGNDVDALVLKNLKSERMARDWYLNVYGGLQRAAAISRSGDSSLADYWAPSSAAAVQQTNGILQELEKEMDAPAERDLFEKIILARKDYLSAFNEVNRLRKEGDAAGSQKIFAEKFDPGSAAYLEMVQKLVAMKRQRLDEVARHIEELRARASLLLAVTAVLSLVIGGWLAWALTRSITRPLHSAETIASSIANMDLSGEMQRRYGSDETGRLLRALDTMRTALQATIHQVRDAAGDIATASLQISNGNQDLSRRTESAASNLQQTAASIEELTSTVAQTAEAAKTARHLASSAVDAASSGGEVVSQVVATMDEIQSSSNRIADIIGVIDGIAFQTNILALNAAVEAARAGEQGRGFAVVAAEVRSLAGRSAEAAKEIRVLIGASLGRVEAGSALVQRAGASMQDIVVRVQRVNGTIGEISVATREQSEGLAQVNTAVGQLDQMTQQNAALVEESSAATESLREQAVRLNEVVKMFRLA